MYCIHATLSSWRSSLKIDGSTRFLGLIGQNISYTLSPLLHNNTLQRLQINAVYLPFDLPPESLGTFLKATWDAGALGFNITRPHKQVIATLVKGEPHASFNTLYRGDRSWEGASTDGAGFAAGLRRMGCELRDFERIIFLGFGGATKAIVNFIEAESFQPTLLALTRDRKVSGSGDLAAEVGRCPIQFLDFSTTSLQGCLHEGNELTLLVQGTDAPRHGDDLRQFAPCLDGFKGAFVDLNYGEGTSYLLEAAGQRGIRTQDGIPMLIEQARLSQTHWFGKSGSYNDMLAAIRGLEV
jgi:shikimate dehydrogenase